MRHTLPLNTCWTCRVYEWEFQTSWFLSKLLEINFSANSKYFFVCVLKKISSEKTQIACLIMPMSCENNYLSIDIGKRLLYYI